MITATTPLQDLCNIATFTLSDVAPEETFLVKDLFRGFEWSRIDKGNRTKLGSMFYSYAKGNGAGIVEPLGKTPQNQQIYRKL